MTASRVLVSSIAAALAVVLAVAPGASASGHARHRLTSVTFVGHGLGSGVGMGQWGAFGYAVRYHFAYHRILHHFYPATRATTLAAMGLDANPTLSVVILENMDLASNVGYDPVVTAPVAMTVTSNSGATTQPTTTQPTTTQPTTTQPTTTQPTTTQPTTTQATTTQATGQPVTGATSFDVAAGMAVDFRLSTAGTWNAYVGASCSSAPHGELVATGLTNPVVSGATSPSAPRSSLLVLCRHDGVDESVRGSIEAYDHTGFARTLNLVPLESYLRGVVPSESPASWGRDGAVTGAPFGRPWGFQALEAQAVASRAFALAYAATGGWNGYASICDTTLCEDYGGASYETPMTDLAVARTSGEVRAFTSTPGAVASTPFSASTGGFTMPSAFRAVVDRGDACVVPSDPSECNPSHTWTTRVVGRSIIQKFRGAGRPLVIRVLRRNGYGAFRGRALVVRLRGTRATLDIPATSFAASLGLNSDWFAIAHVTRTGGVTRPRP